VLSLSYDTKNYNTPPALKFLWEIKQGEYDTGGFEFYSPEYIYDGEMHYPVLSGEMPVGADGATLSYAIIGGAVNVVGANTVEVKFISNSKNYKSPDSIFVKVNILPLEIEVDIPRSFAKLSSSQGLIETCQSVISLIGKRVPNTSIIASAKESATQ
jgi:hypothetical protein